MEAQKPSEDKPLSKKIKKAGYTIGQFCAETNISKTALYAYMSGTKDPTAPKIIAMSRTLKMPIKQLLTMLGNDVTGVPNDE